MKPVVFLDVDGVLNNTASLMEHVHLLPEKVLLVRRLCELSGAVVVISSAWRMFSSPKASKCKLRFALGKAGLPLSFIAGQTPNHGASRGSRPFEIEAWLDANERPPYVILDDEDHHWTDEQRGRWIQCRMDAGLTWDQAFKAAERLAIESVDRSVSTPLQKGGDGR